MNYTGIFLYQDLLFWLLMLLLNTEHYSPKKNISSHILFLAGTKVTGEFSTHLHTLLLHSTGDEGTFSRMHMYTMGNL